MNTNESMMTDAELNERFYNRTITWMKALGEAIVTAMVVIAWIALCSAC